MRGTKIRPYPNSIIEVAAALSLNLIIDYHIGFYTTLIPIGCTSIPSDITAAVTRAHSHFPGYAAGTGLCVFAICFKQFQRPAL